MNKGYAYILLTLFLLVMAFFLSDPMYFGLWIILSIIWIAILHFDRSPKSSDPESSEEGSHDSIGGNLWEGTGEDNSSKTRVPNDPVVKLNRDPYIGETMTIPHATPSESENSQKAPYFGGEKKILPLSEDEILERLEQREYREIEFCSKGGMAVLYTAKDPTLNFKKVCIKIAYSEINPIHLCVAMLKREYSILKELDEIPEVPKCFYKIEEDSLMGIVMEYVEGETLESYATKDISEHERLEIFRNVVWAIYKMHKMKYIHRDINPNNILISGDSVRIIDFGTGAKLEEHQKKKPGTVIITGFYPAPEQIDSNGVSDVTSDIYSLGAILYYMYIKDDPNNFMWSMSISDLSNKGIPEPVARIIHKATHFKSGDRYQSCENIIDDIDKIIHNINLILKFFDEDVRVGSKLNITNEMIGIMRNPQHVISKIEFDLEHQKYFIETPTHEEGIYIFVENKFIRKDKYYLEDRDIFSLFFNKDKKSYFPVIKCEVHA